ncbi:AraC family transcriptional regulator [Pseudomonas lactucae]|uniref:AraC family transcriptional regulator n=1 Tax=Pseudomonas lactucae TaxID=2813360 RepID=A0A9X0Y9Z2_9PSED|nr:AraC family transcriptional regulator [Pseudomonas lactucae]MBN2975972.1 AraC family transcriptional regulator [Pseudomonas lactucae]MBN2985618.1 AraC family transcriptional regulator [Pseudomonas lactucae]
MLGPLRHTADLPVNLLRSLAQLIAQLGLDPDRLCLGLGFNLADLANPQSRVSILQACLMIKRALDMTQGRDRGLGLDMSATESIASMGLVGYAMLTSATLGNAIALGIDMQKQTGALLSFEHLESPGHITLQVACAFHEPEVLTFLVEEAFGMLLNIARTLAGPAFSPSSIELTYPRPTYADHYEHLFRCPVHFDCKDNLFICANHWANTPIGTHDALSNRQVVELLEMSAERGGEIEFVESIERILRRDLRTPLSLSAVAAQLCMSERTLRRRLAQNQRPYQAILDDLRKQRALSLLGNVRMTLDEVAYEVGFSDAQNFRKAFKRWTGHGPRQTRA